MSYKTKLLEILKNTFEHDGYKNLLQKDIVETIYRGKNDVCIYMPSGFGKSLCYQLPIVAKEGCYAIVISPSVAHAKSQVDYLRSIGIASYALNADSSKAWINKFIRSQIYSHSCTMKILYITAELFTTPHFEFFFRNISSIAYVVIDEAHCISSKSHDYRESYEKLKVIKQRYPSIPIIAVTATANDTVKKDISEILCMNSKTIFSMPVIRSNLYYDVYCLDNTMNPIDHLKQFIEKSLKSEDKKVQTVPKSKRNCGLIFCPNCDIAENLCKSLSSLGVSVLTYNRRFKAKKCEEVQNLWTSGEVKVLVTTSCFGIGISKQTVRFVVHWGLPLSYGHYYQESGRAGHDGKKSFCRIYLNCKELNSTYYGIQDKSDSNHPSLQTYKETIRQSFFEMKKSLKKLECRHVAISRYFDETVSACKNRCDVCDSQLNDNEKLIVPSIKHEPKLHCRIKTENSEIFEDDKECIVQSDSDSNVPSIKHEPKLHCKIKTEDSEIFEDDKECIVQSDSDSNILKNVILSVDHSVDQSAVSQLEIVKQKLYISDSDINIQNNVILSVDHSANQSAESQLEIIKQKLYISNSDINIQNNAILSVDHSANQSAESQLEIIKQKLYISDSDINIQNSVILSVDHSANQRAESQLEMIRQKLYNVKEKTETNRKNVECIESDRDDSDMSF